MKERGWNCKRRGGDREKRGWELTEGDGTWQMEGWKGMELRKFRIPL